MAANTLPAFTKSGRIGAVHMTYNVVSTTSQDAGTVGTNSFIAVIADATNGTYVRFIRFMPTATSAVAMNPTTLRVFQSTVITSAATSNANTHLIAEVSGTAQTAGSTTTAIYPYDIPLNFWLPANTSLIVSQAVAQASTNAWKAVVFCGDY